MDQSDAMDEITIEFKPSSALLPLAAGIAFAGAMYLTFLEGGARSIATLPLLLMSALVAAAMTACVVTMAVRSRPGKRAGLVLNRLGMVNRSSLIGPGLIRWSDVVDLRMCSVSGYAYLVVFVGEPAKYARAGGFIRGTLRRLGAITVGSPFSIGTQLLKIDPYELEDLMHEYLAKYGCRMRSLHAIPHIS